MLAVALDREERKHFHDALAVLRGMAKDGVKKFPWQSPDKGGTLPLPKPRDPSKPRVVTTQQLQEVGLAPSGDNHERAAAILGRRILYRDANGDVFDKSGNKIVELVENDMILPMPRN